jgi:hypothetical protein
MACFDFPQSVSLVGDSPPEWAVLAVGLGGLIDPQVCPFRAGSERSSNPNPTEEILALIRESVFGLIGERWPLWGFPFDGLHLLRLCKVGPEVSSDPVQLLVAEVPMMLLFELLAFEFRLEIHHLALAVGWCREREVHGEHHPAL